METAIRKVAENTIGCTRKQATNEWFEEECREVNEEKNALRARVIQMKNTRSTKHAYKQALSRQRYLFRKKKWQLEEEASIEIERYRSIQDSRKFYKSGQER